MSKPVEYKVLVASEEADARGLLTEASGLSARKVADAMAAGAVWLRNAHGIRRLRRRSASLAVGDEIFLNYDEKVLAQSAAPAKLIRDGGRWSVWHKPSGMRSQGSRWGDHTTLGRFAEMHLKPQRESFIVHRLDLAASGLMLLAHDKKSAASLSGQFAARTVEKHYRALVLGKYPSAPQRYLQSIDGKQAETGAVRIEFHPSTKRSLLLVTVKTGRKHQIRRHLAGAGFPIVGDRLYGSESDDGDLRLCACYLAFDDPETGGRIKIEHAAADWR